MAGFVKDQFKRILNKARIKTTGSGEDSEKPRVISRRISGRRL